LPGFFVGLQIRMKNFDKASMSLSYVVC